MSKDFDLSVEVSERYDFDKNALEKINSNPWVKNQWPLVYFIQNEVKKIAYVGESTNFANRIKNHLNNPKKKNAFNQISIIGSDKFNKSATLDLESKLIQYIASEGTYELQNGNYGLLNHNYYQQDLYKSLFKETWRKLLDKNIVSRSLEDIENSELFKFSPYKSLNKDQYNSVLEIIGAITTNDSNQIFIKGSAGTGKTILATYLIKLLHSDYSDLDSNQEELSHNEWLELNLIQKFKEQYPNANIAIVVAMSSLRKTLQNVFRKVPGLKASMVISPSDTFKDKYDLLIVDEAHRLRRYKNIGWRGTFKKNNEKLGLDSKGTELDWIIQNSKHQIFFYDAAQSVKPSDILAKNFEKILNEKGVVQLELKSQMRSQGGNDYIAFVDKLLHLEINTSSKFYSSDYDLIVFDSFSDLYNQLNVKEKELGLCRLVAGYSWPWSSKNDKDTFDIDIDGIQLQWNTTDKDWINSPTAYKEVGCIHTTQGYDINYTGVIFGHEIKYNPDKRQIEIDKTKYYDKNGKIGVDSDEELKAYIINIYKTIMFRGIKGTYIYACDKGLRDYLKKYIYSYKRESLKKEEIENGLRKMHFSNVKPFVNAVPVFDFYAAAGEFSDLQISSEIERFDWVELPNHISSRKGYFVCKVIGESMNKRIPNGSWCLFKQDSGGSREGKIVLVEHYKIQESDFGSGYTVKMYHSKKNIFESSWEHSSITLKPLSTYPIFEEIHLQPDELSELKVIGEFVQVIN